MPNTESSLQWFYDRLKAVFYSMDYRLGQIVNGRPNFDCSSAVYFSLKQGGFFPADMRIGNTDSLFRDLEHNGWVKVTDGSRQRGDVFIWGKRGASGGAAGHTGSFVDTVNVIHCSSGYNGIHVDNYNQLRGWNNNPEDTVYRYIGKDSNPHDQDVSPGAFIKFDKTFTVNEVKEVGGIWQVQCNELCPVNFTWEDNGIPTEPLYEVDADGYATIDQDLSNGSKFVLPGKFEVQDVGEDSGVWLALIEWDGLKFWVDLEPATEIAKDDAGTPIPSQRPQEPQPPQEPPVVQDPKPEPEPPKPQPPTNEPPTVPEPPIPEIPPKEEPEPEEPKPPVNNPKEDKDMAYSEKDRQKLAVVSQNAEEFAQTIANSEEVEKLLTGVSPKTKLIVYIVGDSLIGLGALVPGLAVVLGWMDIVRIVALSGVLVSAGGFLLTMFAIYKSGKK